MMLADLFEKVRADLASQSVSSPVEFSLTTSPLPVCVNPEDMQGQSVILLEKRLWFLLIYSYLINALLYIMITCLIVGSQE